MNAFMMRLLITVLVAAASLAVNGCADGGARAVAADPLAGQRIVVAGGSGRAGRYVLTELAAQRLDFAATTRNEDQARTRLGAQAGGVAWIEADLREPAQAARAVEGADFIICVIGSREFAGPNSAQFVDYEAVRNLVDAAAAGGVRHFVLLSAIGSSDRNSLANKIFKGALEWRFKGEEHLRASGIPYTIVRPAGLTDEPGGIKGVKLWQGDDWRAHARKTISRADLAQVLIESLRSPAARNASFEITNEASEPPGTWRLQMQKLGSDPARDSS
ncbi:MAG: SDR family oxidoreductase [Gammaproteobacteria bacterium]|nr:SDR family oxidoreductase [Gammaproteobacteria bacterium]